jgi:phytoene desaturase
MKEKKRVLIAGAGPGGLAAAILLAKSGVHVTVLEKRRQAGGRTSAIKANGFRFDIGPTFFLYPRVLREIFAAAGRDLDQEVPMVRLDPHYRLVFGAGGELLATSDIARMERSIAALAPADVAGLHRFLEDNRIKLDRFVPCLESPFEAWTDLITPRMLRLLPLRQIQNPLIEGRVVANQSQQHSVNTGRPKVPSWLVNSASSFVCEH